MQTNKTITFLSYYTLNDRMAASARVRRMVDYYKRQNWQTKIITPNIESVSKNKIVRLYCLFRSLIQLSIVALKTKTDFYFISAPPLSMMLPALILQIFSRKKIIFEERDLLTINPLVSYQKLRGNFFMQYIENFLLKNAYAIITPTSGVKIDLEKKWPELKNQTITVVTNGFQRSDYSFISSVPKQKNSGPLRLIHSGNFYGTRNPTPILEALLLLKEKINLNDLQKSFQFIFIGQFADPNYQTRFLECAKELNSLFLFFPLKPYQEVLHEIYQADVALLITHTEGSENAIPAKLFEYIATAKPILAITHDPLVTTPIESHKLGWCIAHDKIEKISDLLFWMHNNHDEVRSMQLPGLNLTEFDSDTQLEKLKTLTEKALT